MVCIHKTVDTLEKAQVWHKKVRAANEPSAITMTEKVPINRVFSWLKVVSKLLALCLNRLLNVKALVGAFADGSFKALKKVLPIVAMVAADAKFIVTPPFVPGH